MNLTESSQADRPADQFADHLLLSLVSGIGPRLRQALLDQIGSAESILSASQSQLCSVPGIGAKLSRAIANARQDIDVDAEIELCRQHGVKILTTSDSGYPRMLREIHDPPAVLYERGQLAAADAVAIAIVGSRHATHYGLAQAERLADSLARSGLTIVSGLARGVDAAAHRGALAAGGRTVAVLASGLARIYPPEHTRLADEVAASGALVSEAPIRAQPVAGAFPQRNRLISGMTLGVIVIEAALRSGALITARHAMEQDREVFALPGRVDSRMSQGCHRLLRDGAKLVETADDVLEELGPLIEPAPTKDGQIVNRPAELLLNDVERKILAVIEADPVPIDQIITTSGLGVGQVLSTLSVLEMRHLVRRLSGGLIVRR